ncbi:MAG TPA: dihydroorotate oxidase [Patescibacteria group bacterium]
MIIDRKWSKVLLMLQTPFYDPNKTYEENCTDGPFGAFQDGKVYENKGNPSYKFLGYDVYLPFGIASGPLFNSKFIIASLDKGFDIVIQKTVRSRKKVANAFPNVVALDIEGDLNLEQAKAGVRVKKSFQEPLTITNSFGNPSFLPDFWQPDLKKSLSHIKNGQVLICAIEGTGDGSGNIDQYVQDWVNTAMLVKETGCPILEANTSCPNEGTNDLLCFDTKRTQQILFAIKNEIGNMPLIVKLAYFADYEKLRKLVQAIGNIVDCISVINTIPTKVIDKNGNLFIEGRPVMGACGDGVRWAGLDMVGNLKKLKEELDMNYTIIGMGGVFNKDHYNEYLDKGANIVMSATGAMWNPYLAQEIKKSHQ